MTDISPAMRQRILERDQMRCLSCGSRNVTLQHRRAKGMGGIGKKTAPLNCADGLALCGPCNSAAEAGMQDDALRYGWKIPRSCRAFSTLLPYFDRITHNWWLPDATGGRQWVDPAWAKEVIADAFG